MAPLVVKHPGARPTNSLEEPVDDTSVRAGDPFDHAASRRRDDAHDKERDCFYCLSGWVFLGSLDHDGEEVFDAVRCRRCGGTGRLRP
jgi:hypothetical protein